MSLLRKKPDDRAAAQKTAQFPKNAGSNTPPCPPTEAEVARLLSARTSVVMGSITAAVLVFGFGLWSVLTEISGAIVASGQLEVSQNRQVVQHPDGGVVKSIAVQEGDTVAAGDLPKWAMPDRIISVPSIPRTSVGKIDKKRIRLDISEWQANNSTFLSTL